VREKMPVPLILPYGFALKQNVPKEGVSRSADERLHALVRRTPRLSSNRALPDVPAASANLIGVALLELDGNKKLRGTVQHRISAHEESLFRIDAKKQRG